MENSSLPVAVRVSKTCVLKLPIVSSVTGIAMETTEKTSCEKMRATCAARYFSS